MAAPFLLIDGYNLMHAAGMARVQYGPGDLERCRNRFLGHLARRLAASQRRRTTVVFDAGDAPPDLPQRHVVEEMTVLFAPPGGDADSLIEELIAAHSAPRRLRVVSSDRRLVAAARRRRTMTVPSEDFSAELERRGPADERPAPAGTRTDPAKVTGRSTAEETRRWLEIFGEIPVAAVDAPPHGSEGDWLAPQADSVRGATRPPSERASDSAPMPEAGHAAGSRGASPPPSDPKSAAEELRMWEARVAELGNEE